MSPPWLVLASASPRRQQLLTHAGYEFEVDPADVDESPLPHEEPGAYVERLARAKAEAVAARRGGAVVLGADTIVVLDDNLLGKPADADDARRTLRRLSGRMHAVITGVALVHDGVTNSGVATSTVWFRDLDDATIAAYVATGEPLDKAGSYAIQGGAAGFVEKVEGPFDNIVGLPLALVGELLATSRS